MSHAGLIFGIFLAPFHRLGDNPTLAIRRDLDLIEWLDHLGYDEAWVGEHHSAGWETIAAPELVIAAAAERTRNIRIGSGVTSLPYHNPFLVAQRFTQLDHMTRGRAMLGCGPGALVSDAYMFGIEPALQRRRMDEALDVIMALLAGETITREAEWFTLRQARLHLAPYTAPHFPIAVASTLTPSGVMAAARHGLGLLSLGAGLPGGADALAKQWTIAEETAAAHGKTMERRNWRLVLNLHVAEDDAQALAEVRAGERRETVDYFEKTLARPPGRAEDPLSAGVAEGTTLVGSPETVATGIERLIARAGGDIGGIMFRAHEWANREQTWRSFELFARWVMPRFQRSVDSLAASNAWTRSNRETIFKPNVEAIRRAYTDAGKAVPAAFDERVSGATPKPG